MGAAGVTVSAQRDVPGPICLVGACKEVLTAPDQVVLLVNGPALEVGAGRRFARNASVVANLPAICKRGRIVSIRVICQGKMTHQNSNRTFIGGQNVNLLLLLRVGICVVQVKAAGLVVDAEEGNLGVAGALGLGVRLVEVELVVRSSQGCFEVLLWEEVGFAVDGNGMDAGGRRRHGKDSGGQSGDGSDCGGEVHFEDWLMS